MTRYFNNVQTLEELRKPYRDLLKKYHPDNANGSTEATQEINAEYDKLFKILKDQHDSKASDGSQGSDKAEYNSMEYDFSEDTKLRKMLNKIIHFDGITVEIIGNWIWCFDSYGYRVELKELGFKYARNKKVWYYHTEAFRKKSHKSLSIHTDTFKDSLEFLCETIFLLCIGWYYEDNFDSGSDYIAECSRMDRSVDAIITVYLNLCGNADGEDLDKVLGVAED